MITERPTFLTPMNHVFPFDSICEAIVEGLIERRFQVPGLVVDVATYGSGKHLYQYVSRIAGDFFELDFGRVQYTFQNGLNDIAGVIKITIPRMQLSLDAYQHLPTLYMYVGADWTADQAWFTEAVKYNAKQQRKPRNYLVYKSSLEPYNGHNTYGTYPNKIPPYLVSYTGWNQEYEPQAHESKHYDTDRVLQLFTEWIRRNVLPQIEYAPSASNMLDPLADPQPIWYDGKLGPLYTFATYETVARIRVAQNYPKQVDPRLNYGLNGAGVRPDLRIHANGATEFVGMRQYVLCGIGELTRPTSVHDVVIPGYYPRDENFVLEVTPTRANDVLVAEFGDVDLTRKFTQRELHELTTDPAYKVVPVNDYTGGYCKPVVLIGRVVDVDEVRVVTHLKRF